MTPSNKLLLALFVACTVSACSLLQPQQDPIPDPSINLPTPTPVPTQDEVLPEIELKRMKNAPSAVLPGRTVQDLMIDIEKYRLSRGMKVVTKTRNRIEFTAPVARAK
ncbi:MAG TPA: hypothetical protein VLC08_14920, partial [Chitinolyticbacter sp.]|nr:hypothetical protein [Chitinolyticbacter sp.]